MRHCCQGQTYLTRTALFSVNLRLQFRWTSAEDSNLRPPGYESDELDFGKSRNARNLRKTQNLAGFKRNRHGDHGDHDDQELATFWLQ